MPKLYRLIRTADEKRKSFCGKIGILQNLYAGCREFKTFGRKFCLGNVTKERVDQFGNLIVLVGQNTYTFHQIGRRKQNEKTGA